MNTDKVIELGKVSEETKGSALMFERPLDYSTDRPRKHRLVRRRHGAQASSCAPCPIIRGAT